MFSFGMGCGVEWGERVENCKCNYNHNHSCNYKYTGWTEVADLHSTLLAGEFDPSRPLSFHVIRPIPVAIHMGAVHFADIRF